MEEFFHLTINNLSNTNLIAFSVISMGPRVIGHFLEYLDIHCFYSLKDTLYLLEYAKHVITKSNDLSGVRSLEMSKPLLGPSAPLKLFLCAPAYFSTTPRPCDN